MVRFGGYLSIGQKAIVLPMTKEGAHWPKLQNNE